MMGEKRYEPEDWMELHDLIMRMDDDDIDNQDYYEIDGWGLDIIKKAGEYIKTQLGIFTGKMITESPMTGEKYEVNIWTTKGDGLIHALSKRPIKND